MAPITAAAAASRICWSCRAHIMNRFALSQLRRTLPAQVRAYGAGGGFDNMLELAQKLRDDVRRKRKFVEGAEVGEEDEADVQSTYQTIMAGPEPYKTRKV